MATVNATAELCEFLTKYADKMEEIQRSQQFKLATLVAGSQKQLEKTISEQQASIMAIQSLENKRISLQQQTGFGSMTFKEILEACDESYREDLEKVFSRISDAVASIKFSNNKAMNIAKENLGENLNQQKDYGYTEELTKKDMNNNTSFLQTKI